MVGDEGHLYQAVAIPEPHTGVVFKLTEIQHMYSGLAELRIFGSYDGVQWTEVFFRPEPQAPFNSVENRTSWWTFSYPVASDHAYYMVEFYGKMLAANDGWKFSCLDLRRAN